MMMEAIVYLGLAGLACLGMFLIILMVKTRAAFPMIAIMAAMFLLVYLGTNSLRGTPKALNTETARVEAHVLWVSVIPHKRVYLMLIWPGLQEPRYFQMPWTQDLENQLQQARANSIAKRLPLMFKVNGAKTTHSADGVEGMDGGASEGDGHNTNEGARTSVFYPGAPPPIPEKSP